MKKSSLCQRSAFLFSSYGFERRSKKVRSMERWTSSPPLEPDHDSELVLCPLSLKKISCCKEGSCWLFMFSGEKVIFMQPFLHLLCSHMTVRHTPVVLWITSACPAVQICRLLCLQMCWVFFKNNFFKREPWLAFYEECRLFPGWHLSNSSHQEAWTPLGAHDEGGSWLLHQMGYTVATEFLARCSPSLWR